MADGPDPVPPPPSGRGPRHERHSRRRLVAAVLAGGLLLVGLLSALPMLTPAPTVQPTTAGTAPELVTVSPAPPSGTATTLATGGGIGRPVAFESTAGAGTVTVSSATWTDAGDEAPAAGQCYLVLDVTVAAGRGAVPVSPVLFAVADSRGASLPAFGPTLQRPLGGQVVAAGRQVSGQLGYSVVPGPVQLHLLDEDLKSLAGIEIPGP